jgi:hypothetical protein
MIRALLRAAHDAAHYFGLSLRTVITGALLLGIGIVLHVKVRGEVATREELASRLMLDFAPAFIFLTALFLFNVLRAPYLIYLEDYGKTQTAIDQVQGDKAAIQDELKKANEEIERLKKTTPTTGNQASDKIQAAIRKVLLFPNAAQDSAPPKTMMETLLTNQTPRKLFGVLFQNEESAISAIPECGPVLRDFLHKYYQFESDTGEFENELLERIGGIVFVRFPQGWQIYLRYAISRFSGLSKDQIIAGGNFLNYEITWDDAERVYNQLSGDPQITKRFSNTFSQYKDFVETTDKLTRALQ